MGNTNYSARFGPAGIALVSVLAFGGCGQGATPVHASSSAKPVRASAPVVAPDPNRPPSDTEILSALLGFWRDRGNPSQYIPPSVTFRLVTPVGATQSDNAMTRNAGGTRVRTVGVTYTFRANSDLTYMCMGVRGEVVDASPAPSAPEITLPNPVSAGGTFSCPVTVAAERLEEGWNIHPVDGDLLAYLFKR